MLIIVPMTNNKTEVVISKENAVFWMDGNGRWRNAHGEFRHKKIIEFFHTSIEKDDGGYFLRQDRGDVVEKVYFRYEETAVFVFDVILSEDIVLVLNTGRRIRLAPDRLFVKGDSLLMHAGNEVFKFTDRSMMKIGRFIDEKEDRFFFSRNAEHHLIQQE